MNLPHHSPAPARYVGIGLVVALHLACIYALSIGLMKPPAKRTEVTVMLPRPDDHKPEPVKPDPVKAVRPTLTAPVIDVPTPPTWDETPPLRAEPLQPGETPRAVPGGQGLGSGPTVAPPTVTAVPSVSAPGAVCSGMPRPDVPAVNWSGEAVLQVLATVRGGRVVGTEFRLAQGAPDARTRRSLQRAVESALAGYQCQGDALFQQDFAFRLD